MTARSAVVFVHGIAPKPAPAALLERWLRALARPNPMPSVFPPPNLGVDLRTHAVDVRLAYYADVFYGAASVPDVEIESDTSVERELAAAGLAHVDDAHRDAHARIAAPVDDVERRFLRTFEATLATRSILAPAATLFDARAALERGDAELLAWLPPAVKATVRAAAVRETFAFLFDKDVARGDGTTLGARRTLRTRLLAELAAAADAAPTLVIVAHGTGALAAYDVLRSCAECPAVDTVITLGSPLGVREVRARLVGDAAAELDVPTRALRRWINLYDPLDPLSGALPAPASAVASTGDRIVDVAEPNWGAWRHAATHYLSGDRLRALLAAAVGVPRT